MSQEVPSVEYTQSEKLEQIGAYLRQVREDNSISIEQVAAHTMIQARLLRAIEKGDLNQLPEPVYIQGFIRRYAEALGLNGAEIARAFPTQPDVRAIQPSWKDSAAAQLRPLHLYAAYVALIVAAVSGLSYLLTPALTRSPNNQERASVAVPADESQEAEPDTAAAPPTTEANTASLPTPARPLTTEQELEEDELASDKPVQIELRLTERSWLRVMVDGKKDFEGVLPEGTERSWTADNQVTVRAGNAGGVLLTHNGGNEAAMGAPGSVQEMTFSANQPAENLSASEPSGASVAD